MIIKKHLYYLLLGSLCAVFAACGGSSSIPMAEVGSSAKSIDTTNYPPPRQMGPSAIRATLSENFNVEAWAIQNGAPGRATGATGIGVDDKGNSYVAGVTFENIPGQEPGRNSNYFIAKHASNGTPQWIRQVGIAGGSTEAAGISVDSNGNSYVTGSTTVGLSGQIQDGIKDYFIAKYDLDGNLQWARQVGGFDGHTEGKGVSVDSMGNSYVTGKTTTGLSGQTQKGDRDYFIAKYNTNGILLEASQEGTLGGITGAYGISLDGAGNRYVTGATTIGIFGQTQKDDLDYFIVKNR